MIKNNIFIIHNYIIAHNLSSQCEYKTVWNMRVKPSSFIREHERTDLGFTGTDLWPNNRT